MRELARREGPRESPLQRLDTRELSHLLEAILRTMPEKQRLVFVMFELEEMSGEEIARLLDVPLGTVRSRLSLARAAFQREVKLLGEPTAEFPLGDRRVPKMGGL